MNVIFRYTKYYNQSVKYFGNAVLVITEYVNVYLYETETNLNGLLLGNYTTLGLIMGKTTIHKAVMDINVSKYIECSTYFH